MYNDDSKFNSFQSLSTHYRATLFGQLNLANYFMQIRLDLEGLKI